MPSKSSQLIVVKCKYILSFDADGTAGWTIDGRYQVEQSAFAGA